MKDYLLDRERYNRDPRVGPPASFSLTSQDFLIQCFDPKTKTYSAPEPAKGLPPPPPELWQKAPGPTICDDEVRQAIE